MVFVRSADCLYSKVKISYGSFPVWNYNCDNERPAPLPSVSKPGELRGYKNWVENPIADCLNLEYPTDQLGQSLKHY
jgi:hypothetical protein